MTARGDIADFAWFLEPSERELAGWLAARGSTLDDEPATLETIDDAIDSWYGDPAIAPSLAVPIALHLGQVIVIHTATARWHAWPNGHPVVRLHADHDVDVLDLVQRRITTGAPSLTAVLDGLPAR